MFLNVNFKVCPFVSFFFFWHDICLTHPSEYPELVLQQLLAISFFHLRGLPAAQYTNIRPHFRRDPRRKSREASNLVISKFKQRGPLPYRAPSKPLIQCATNCCCNILMRNFNFVLFQLRKREVLQQDKCFQ